MGSGSAARDLRLNNSASVAPQPAKIIPFRREEPMAEARMRAFGTASQIDSAIIIQFNRLLEAKYEQKEKGAIRRAAEPPSDHYLMAWVVWVYYLVAYTKAGLKVSEESRRLEIHQKSVSGLGK
jgi:hypothetical protein